MGKFSLAAGLVLLCGNTSAAEPTFRVCGGKLAMSARFGAEALNHPHKGSEGGHLIVQVPVTATGSRRLDPAYGKVIASAGKLLLCYRFMPVTYPKGGPSLTVAYTQVAEWSFPDIPSGSPVQVEVSAVCE